MSTPSLRAHFVNENIGGHATMHLHLRAAVEARDDIDATHFDVPPPTGLRRLAGGRVPGLAALDADLQPLRSQLAVSAAVRRHLRTLPRPDALHVYTHNAGLLSIRYLRSIPSVVSLDVTNRDNAYRIPGRSPTRFTPVALRATLPFERRVYDAAHRVVAQSRWAADSLVGYGVPAAKVEVIPYGIVPSGNVARRSGSRTPTIAFVATSMTRKGGWLLLDLWRRTLRGRAELLLVTKEPVPSEPGLEVRNDVAVGSGAMADLLAKADVLAMPSEIDAFGYAVLEAMDAGLPVVAVEQAALPEIVADGETGVLVPPGDAAAFGAALGRLVDDAETRLAMGAAGRRRLLERFDAHHTTGALVELLRHAAER